MVSGRMLFGDVSTNWHSRLIDMHISTLMHVLCKYEHTEYKQKEYKGRPEDD